MADNKISEPVSLKLMAKVFTNSGEAILISDAQNKIVAANAAFTKLTGYTAEEVLGKDPKILSSGKTPKEVYQRMWKSLSEQNAWEGELWDRSKSGEIYPKWLSISVIRDENGQITNYIGSFNNISERKASEEKFLRLAYHDALTNLPNRLNLHERLEQIINLSKQNHQKFALLLIDLDRFKSINDTLGHHIGDLLLIEVARRLTISARETDTVARLGGDEFVVVLTEIESPADAADVAHKVVQMLSAPYLISGNDLRTSPSIGICIYPDDACEIGMLLKSGDVAMYHAKAKGRGNYQFFTEEMNRVVMKRQAMEADLHLAMERRQFVLYYQPQLDLNSGHLIGVEALVRWQHPTRGLIPPAEFISVAEEMGLIVQLGSWVLREACWQLKQWQGEGMTDIRMSVNLSALQFLDKDLAEHIQAILAETGLAADCLDLEVTESMSMASPGDTIAIMQVLAECGMTLSIDDFGTGYSSLAYLKLFPIHTLKIDRSFVKDIEIDTNDADICDVTVLLAHKMGLNVVAEGVETEAQLKFLLSIGCNKIQGFLISKPLPADRVKEFFNNYVPRTELGTVNLWTT